eukprot:scaffold667455_cov61-Prasinocladus_malaysianus.AAC.1
MHPMYGNQQGVPGGMMDASRGWGQPDQQSARMGQMDPSNGWMGQPRQYAGLDQGQNGGQMMQMQGYNNFAANPALQMQQPAMQGYTTEWPQQPQRQPAYNYMQPGMHHYQPNGRPMAPGIDHNAGCYPNQNSTSGYASMGHPYPQQQPTGMPPPSPVTRNWNQPMAEPVNAGGGNTSLRQSYPGGNAPYDYWQGSPTPMHDMQPQNGHGQAVVQQHQSYPSHYNPALPKDSQPAVQNPALGANAASSPQPSAGQPMSNQ